jgi:uncharacterized protein (TIGR03083 family)
METRVKQLTEVSCETCTALCCHAPINMIMTKQEYKRHRRTMDLQVIAEPRAYRQRVGYEGGSNSAGESGLEVPAGHGLFELVSGCANLTPSNRCSIYSTRPGCCRDFAVGSAACLKLRRDAGLDGDDAAVDEPARDSLVDRYLGEGRRSFAPKPLDLAEARKAVGEEAAWIIEHLSGIELRAWSRRTRCTGWDISTLAAHVVGVLQFADAALSAVVEGSTAHAPVEFRTKGTAVIAPLERAAKDVARALAAMSPAGLEREVTIDDITVGVDHLVQVLVMELAVHGCDLADALRVERHLSPVAIRATANVLPDLLDSGDEPVHAASYVLVSDSFAMPFRFRGETWVNEPAEDMCTIEGEAEALLLFALGREPFDAEVLVTKRAVAARAFKRHLQGP